jgi:hypothetical protein
LLSVKCTHAAERLSALAFVRSRNGAFCFPTLAGALRQQGAVEAAGSFEAAVQTY